MEEDSPVNVESGVDLPHAGTAANVNLRLGPMESSAPAAVAQLRAPASRNFRWAPERRPPRIVEDPGTGGLSG